jgi:osmotically-inducible protein OsmY
MSETQLRQSVVDELHFDPSLDASNISVQANNGVVTLMGHIPSFAEKIAAQVAARRVRGVRGLADELEVRCPHHKRTADDEIANRALKILEWYAILPENPVQITVQNGLISLSGEVVWQYQKTAAEHAVRKLSGIIGVVNNITIRHTVCPSDIKRKIEDALARHAKIEAGGIQVSIFDGNTISLQGKVDSWEERIAAENAAWSVAGVRSVENRLITAVS